MKQPISIPTNIPNMRKILIYGSFIVAVITVVFLFVTAKTYLQLAFASILYIPLAYFGFKIFPRKDWTLVTLRRPVEPIRKTEVKAAEIQKERVEIADIDKRTFLKLIGATGLSFFIFSLLGRRVDTLISGPSGLVNPQGESGASPTEGYKISEIDDSAVTYYGFTNANGGWLIMQEDTNTSSFRYAKGSLNFSANWANRAKLKYDYYYNLF